MTIGGVDFLMIVITFSISLGVKPMRLSAITMPFPTIACMAISLNWISVSITMNAWQIRLNLS